VDFASVHHHLPQSILKDTFVLLSKPCDHLIHDLGLMVTQLAVIHMEAYCHLLPFDHFVSHAWIVQIEFETDSDQTLGELAIV
jgi:hypothetical protein